MWKLGKGILRLHKGPWNRAEGLGNRWKLLESHCGHRVERLGPDAHAKCGVKAIVNPASRVGDIDLDPRRAGDTVEKAGSAIEAHLNQELGLVKYLFRHTPTSCSDSAWVPFVRSPSRRVSSS